LGLLAGSLAHLGDFEGALVAGQRALIIAQQKRRPIDIGTACYFTGFANAHRGNFQAAIRVLKQGYNACKSGNVDYMIPWLSGELGLSLMMLKRDGSGRALLDDALHQCDSMNLLYARARTLVRLSQACLLTDEVPLSHQHAIGALEIARMFHYRAVEVWALQLRGECKARLGQHRSSVFDFHHALKKSEVLQMLPDSAHLMVRLAECKLGDMFSKKDALRLREAIVIYERLGMRHYKQYARKLMGKPCKA
jgi:hypothetical protein